MTSLLPLLVVLLSQAAAQPLQPGPRAGDVYEITRVSDMTQTDSEGSSANSHDRDAWIERVILVRGDGVEVEFDLPADATAEDRARVWQFPARALRPPRGPLRLLNGPELEARLARWLERAQWSREMCGRWIFTWNAFKIECDPQSVLETLAVIDLAATELRDGAPYTDPAGLAPGALRRDAGAGGGAVLTAELQIDPEKARREAARSEAVVTEIMGDRPELREARAARALRNVSGTITVRFESDAAGRVLRRTRVIRLEAERMGGARETRTSTETVERRLVALTRP